MFSNIQIPYFSSTTVEENIGGFDISVDNIGLMQFIEALEHIVCDLPYLFLWDSTLDSLSLFDAILNRKTMYL